MKTLNEIVDALKKSKFECAAGPLESHVAFIELEEKLSDIYSHCCLGKDHPCALNVNDGYCAADVCQYKVKGL